MPFRRSLSASSQFSLLQDTGQFTTSDGPENYDILEDVDYRGPFEAHRYLARCKKGRLRNRLIVLTKTTRTSRFYGTLTSSLKLHQTLSHLSIISLHSIFSNSTACFAVTEFCPGGSLAEYINTNASRRISDGDLRQIVRCLVDGLVYLCNEDVVHRDLNPANILLTVDNRPKISGFEHASRLPCANFDEQLSAGPDYIAPEILSGTQHDCKADLWSLGCLAFTCATGRCPFEADELPDMFNKIMRADYYLPPDVGPDVRGFIGSLLRVDPLFRTPASRLLNHPFLRNTTNDSTLSQTADTPFSKASRVTFDEIPPVKRSISDTIMAQNNSLRKLLQDELSDVAPSPALPPRIVSDPFIKPSAAFSKLSSPVPADITPINDPAIGRDMVIEEDEHESEVDEESYEDIHPIGISRPTASTTRLLSPRTHKTTYGQMTILPSRSLLVDIREGQRRRGEKGDEVVVIGPNGKRVEIHNAPHLSVPCCLVEPAATYQIETLPVKYWKLYNDAANFVDKLKQRTARLVFYEPDVRCTLMANEPVGDVELLFQPVTNVQGKGNDFKKPSMRIRLSRQARMLEIARCSKKEWSKKSLSTVESAGLLSLSDMEKLTPEEKKGIADLKNFLRICGPCEAELTRSDSPSAREHESLLVTQNVFPQDSNTDQQTASLRSNDKENRVNHETIIRPRPTHDSGSNEVTRHKYRNYGAELGSARRASERPQGRILTSSSLTRVLSSFDVTQRPRKFSATPTATPSVTRTPLQTKNISHEASRGHSDEVATSCLQAFDSTIGHATVQTRFLPDVGWCIRYDSRVSQGGRYKIMFTAGATLEIDVDEEWMAYADGTKAERYAVHNYPPNAHLRKSMKAFEAFLSAFDVEDRN